MSAMLHRAAEMSPFRLMPDQVLADAVADLERICSQPRLDYVPAREREAYLGELVRARAELSRRAGV